MVNSDVSLSPARRRSSGLPPVVLSLPQLQDEVLALTELVLALELTVVAIAEQTGSSGLGLTGLHFLPTLLGGLSWSDVEISHSGTDTVTIKATTPGSVRMSMAAVVAQAVLGFDHIKLDLVRADSGDSLVARLPMEPFRRFAASDNALDRERCVLELLARAETDTGPIVSARTAAKCICVRACETLTAAAPLAETLASLRSWRQLARSLRLDEADKELGRAMRWSLSRDTSAAFDLVAEGSLFEIAAEQTEALSEDLL